MAEWQESHDSIDVLGHACLSLLASSLQAYLHTRVKMHCEELTEEERKRVFRKGWVRGYNIIFTEAFGISFANGPVCFHKSISSQLEGIKCAECPG